MRRVVLALSVSALALAAIQSASAADIPAPVIGKAPVMVAAYNWTGFYVGAHGGGAWAKSDWGYDNSQPYSAQGPGVPPTPLKNSFDPSSWVAGGQAGYNRQFGQWVLGVEVSGSATGLDQTIPNVIQYPPPGPGAAQVFVGTEIKTLFTATGRIGFLAAPQWLVFAKGGYAGGEVETSGSFVPNFPGLVLNFNTSEWHHGWTVGVGTEYRFANNFTLGVAYEFIDLSRKNHIGNIAVAPAGNPANQVIHPVQVDVHMVTARLNYLFAWP